MIKQRKLGSALRVCLSLGAMIAATSVGLPSAHAGTTTRNDSFDSGWQTWKSGGYPTLFVGSTTLARSPSNAAKLFWPSGGSTANWAMIHKNFYMQGTQNGGDYSALTGCAAGVYVKNGASPAQGQIELIDTIKGTYVGTKAFSLAGSSGWTWLVVSNSWACSPWLSFRIVVANTTAVQTVIADDLTIQWYWQ